METIPRPTAREQGGLSRASRRGPSPFHARNNRHDEQGRSPEATWHWFRCRLIRFFQTSWRRSGVRAVRGGARSDRRRQDDALAAGPARRGLPESRRILVLEPRRLAARAAARRMARNAAAGSATKSAIRCASIASTARGRAFSSSRPASCFVCCTTTLSSNRPAPSSSTSSTNAAWRAISPSAWSVCFSRRFALICASSSCRRRWRSNSSPLTWAVVP